MLTDTQVARFASDGFIRLDEAIPRSDTDSCRALLWQLSGCDPNNRATWTKPVIRIGERTDAPFLAAANSERLRQALDQLLVKWAPRQSLGTFPIRFPSSEDPGDSGWHVDASFPGDDASDYLSYRINVHSRGRAALLLMLFSDVGLDDAPTRILVGSHRQVARTLEPYGERGLSFMELSKTIEVEGEMAYATGSAGTVYLCHPFLAHAAQPHRGAEPRFLAQPAIFGPPATERAMAQLALLIE